MLRKFLLWLGILSSCVATPQRSAPAITIGAAQFDVYLPLLQDKKVALLVNQTSCVGEEHLVDLLLDKGIAVQKVFA
ncbi:MAG: DUF1343 domain-containing protein, partial [Bacteroidota bacterium]